MYRVLSTSRNVRLLLERNDILALAGVNVISPRHPDEAVMLAAREDVDAVVIGHSVDADTRKAIIADLRRVRPALPYLLRVCSAGNEGRAVGRCFFGCKAKDQSRFAVPTDLTTSIDWSETRKISLALWWGSFFFSMFRDIHHFPWLTLGYACFVAILVICYALLIR